MDLSNSQRVMLVGKHLLTGPTDIPRYVRWSLINLWFRKQVPVDLEVPWLSWAAIDFLKSFVSERMHVFEYGTGGSTLFFARRCRLVVSVEDDQNWFNLVSDRLALNGITNVRIHLRPFDFRNPNNFARSAYLNAIGEETYDVILIDGQDWSYNERPACFKRAEQNIARDGIIVVDDSWSPTYRALRNKKSAKRVRVFEGTGPCRLGVTSTDIYFY